MKNISISSGHEGIVERRFSDLGSAVQEATIIALENNEEVSVYLDNWADDDMQELIGSIKVAQIRGKKFSRSGFIK